MNRRLTAPRVGELVAELMVSPAAETLRREVAKKLYWIPREVVEEAFERVCMVALTRGQVATPAAVYTFVRTSTEREAPRLLKKQEREQCGLDEDELTRLARGEDDPETKLLEVERQAELVELYRGLVKTLSDRQREVLALYLNGLKKPAIARQLGISERIAQRDLERAMRVARSHVVELAGRGCASGHELISRTAFGLASERQRADAQLHLSSGCPTCSGLQQQLELWREKVGAVLPLPIAGASEPQLTERILHKATDALASVKQQASDGAAQLKHQAVTTYYRALDPTPLAGARPGALGAAVASCLALGGTAGYCVEQGVNPVESLVGVVQPQPQQGPVPKAEEKRPEPPIPPVATEPPAPSPPPEPAVSSSPSDAPAPQTPAPAPEPPPAPAPEPTPAPVEFGEPATTAVAPQPAAVTRPAPVPQNSAPDLYGP
jgi:DNA-directed RNA polymerase specialized sigma24 family protein